MADNAERSSIDWSQSQADDKSFFAYFFFVDVVGSSITTLDIKQQVHKLESFYKILGDILYPKLYPGLSMPIEPRYWNSTGDGAVFCFTKPLDPFRLSIALQKDLNRYNRQREEKSRKKSSQGEMVETRIGISGGATLDIKHTNGSFAPWGRGMVVARRIMDMARPNQILCSEWITKDAKLFNQSFKFYDMGEHSIKWGDRVAICSFLYEDKDIKIDNVAAINCDCVDHAPTCTNKA